MGILVLLEGREWSLIMTQSYFETLTMRTRDQTESGYDLGYISAQGGCD